VPRVEGVTLFDFLQHGTPFMGRLKEQSAVDGTFTVPVTRCLPRGGTLCLWVAVRSNRCRRVPRVTGRQASVAVPHRGWRKGWPGQALGMLAEERLRIGGSTGHELLSLKRSAAVRRTGSGVAFLLGTQGIQRRHAQPFVAGQVVTLLLILRRNGVGREEIGDVSRWDFKQGKRSRQIRIVVDRWVRIVLMGRRGCWMFRGAQLESVRSG
jgi:hypothetical protein